MISPVVQLVLLFNCSEPVIENHTDKWTGLDQQNYEQAIKRCPELYKDSPCLKVFIKKEDRVYNAICGGENG